MKNKIVSELQQLAKEHDIRILYACESGSRAWGFPSKDSDYDVRFIYVHKLPWYLTVNAKKDTVNPPIDEVYDLAGWELRKTLSLVKKSNAVIYEWLQSPMVYLMDENFKNDLWTIMKNYFSPISAIHHYLNLANKAVTGIEYNANSKIRIKSLFYSIRTLLVAMWINEKQTIPPMTLQQLTPLISSEKEIIAHINELLVIKEKANESTLTYVNKRLHAFIFSNIEFLTANANNLPANREKADALDKLLYENIVHEHTGS